MAPVVALKPHHHETYEEVSWSSPAARNALNAQVYMFPRAQALAVSTVTERRWPPALSLGVIVLASAGLWGLIGLAVSSLV